MYGVAALPSTVTCQPGSNVAFKTTAAIRFAVTVPAKRPFGPSSTVSTLLPAGVVDSAVKALKGETLPKVIDTGFFWYDKTNMTDPKIAAVLYD